jgi:microcystin-dependent protein
MGTILGWAPNYAPKGWAFCAGQTMPIQQYSAVFALLGVTYGGNGTTTFQLPNLQGRVPIGAGQSGGTSAYSQGEISGSETVTLTSGQMPAHNHIAVPSLTSTISAATGAATAASPSGTEVLATFNGSTAAGEAVTGNMYAPASSANTTLQGGPVTGTVNIGMAGNSLPVSLIQPYLVIQNIICLEGIFPPRP